MSARSQSSRRLRPDATILILGLGVVALCILGIGLGASFMPPDRVLFALFGDASQTDQIIVWTLRMPRVALALLAGAALALAGAILQRVTRNPLAAPSVLGITDGAALGVVVFLWLFSNESNTLRVSIHWQPVAAILGATVFAVLVATLTLADSRGRGPLSVILYGIALSALAKAAVTMLMILGPVYRAGQAMTWMTGTVGAAHWSDVATLAAALAVAVPVLWITSSALGQMRLDDDSAVATGLPLVVAQAAFLALAVVLTAVAVAHAGAIGFVGLTAPHAARLMIGDGGRAFLCATALTGAGLVLGADIIARIIAPPLELPAGALTALIGAPLFLYLLVRRNSIHA